MILLSTIQKRLRNNGVSSKDLRFGFDIRYPQRWFRDYPHCFPKFMLSGDYEAKFVYTPSIRWEIHKKK
jgi:hypothetical protein